MKEYFFLGSVFKRIIFVSLIINNISILCVYVFLNIVCGWLWIVKAEYLKDFDVRLKVLLLSLIINYKHIYMHYLSVKIIHLMKNFTLSEVFFVTFCFHQLTLHMEMDLRGPIQFYYQLTMIRWFDIVLSLINKWLRGDSKLYW